MPDIEERLTAVEEEVARLRDFVAERDEAIKADLANIPDLIKLEFRLQDQKNDRRFAAVDRRFDAMEADIAELKTDIAELKTDVSELKKDVSELKRDVSELKNDMGSVLKILNDQFGPKS